MPLDKMKPLITIITPTYNSGDLIEKCINNVAGQSFKSIEHLIMDGASTDRTVEVLKKASEKHSHVSWISENDEGIYEAMNKGIRMAKGEWIFFLGCDDSFYDTDVLMQICKTIEHNSQAKFIYGSVYLSKPFKHSPDLVYDGEFDSNMLLYKNICHQSIFYHKSLFDQFGLFRTKYKLFADWDFNLRCFNKVKPYYVDKIIANFNIEGRSSDKSLDGLFKENLVENMTLYYPYTYRHPFFEGKKRELFSIMLKKARRLNYKAPVRIFKILTYQILKKNKVKH
jgi:glycosyltransferase involved in cell wall biosynthesis